MTRIAVLLLLLCTTSMLHSASGEGQHWPPPGTQFGAPTLQPVIPPQVPQSSLVTPTPISQLIPPSVQLQQPLPSAPPMRLQPTLPPVQPVQPVVEHFPEVPPQQQLEQPLPALPPAPQVEELPQPVVQPQPPEQPQPPAPQPELEQPQPQPQLELEKPIHRPAEKPMPVEKPRPPAQPVQQKPLQKEKKGGYGAPMMQPQPILVQPVLQAPLQKQKKGGGQSSFAYGGGMPLGFVAVQPIGQWQQQPLMFGISPTAQINPAQFAQQFVPLQLGSFGQPQVFGQAQNIAPWQQQQQPLQSQQQALQQPVY